MCADANGKMPRRILFRQGAPRARLRSEDPEDTSAFPVQAPLVARIRHNRSFIVPPEPLSACGKPEARARLGMDEITRGVPAGRKKDEIPRGVEMMEIWLVQEGLSRRMRYLFPDLSEIELLGLMCRLDVAARDAGFVADGMSPKREFFAKLPTDLLGPVRAIYRDMDSIPPAL